MLTRLDYMAKLFHNRTYVPSKTRNFMGAKGPGALSCDTIEHLYRGVRTIVAFLFCSVLPGPSNAQTAADEAAFFAGKQIRLVVGFGVGGGYDAYARLIAPYLARELDANVVVENQPGAGGVTALNTFVTSKPDGLRIMLANGWSNGISQLMGATGVRYDLTRVSHLGTISSSPSVWL